MSRSLLITLALVIGAALGAVAYVYFAQPSWLTGSASAAALATKKRTEVVALGRLVPAKGIHGIGAIPGDVIDKVEVQEGSPVKIDTVVAVLKSKSLRELEAAAVEKQLREAGNRVEAEKEAADSRIELATLALQQAEAGDTTVAAQKKQIALLQSVWKLEKNRFEQLKKVSDSAVSANERSTQELLVAKSDAELDAAKATLESLELANRFGVDKAKAELRAANAAKKQILSGLAIASLEKRYEQALKQVELTDIKSPINGVVLSVFSKAGEVVGPARIMTVADVGHMVCRAEVYQNDVKHLRAALKNNKAGLKAVLTSQAFEPPKGQTGLYGTLKDPDKIGRLVSPPVTDPTDPFARADVEVVEVEIELAGEDATIASQYVNLQVNVSFDFPDGIEESSPRLATEPPTNESRP